MTENPEETNQTKIVYPKIYINSPGNILQQIYTLLKSKQISPIQAQWLKQLTVEQNQKITEIQKIFEQNRNIQYLQYNLINLLKSNYPPQNKQKSTPIDLDEEIQIQSNSSLDNSFKIESLDNLSIKNLHVLNQRNSIRNSLKKQNENKINVQQSKILDYQQFSDESDENDPEKLQLAKSVENLNIQVSAAKTQQQPQQQQFGPVVRSNFYFQSVEKNLYNIQNTYKQQYSGGILSADNSTIDERKMSSSCDRLLERKKRTRKNLSVKIQNSNFKKTFNKSISHTALKQF